MNLIDNSGQPRILIKNPGSLSVQVGGSSAQDTGVSVNDGQWHHLALTWTNAIGRVELYMDGSLATVLTSMGAGSLIQPGPALYFGYLSSNPDPVLENDAYRGELDEVRFWSEKRTATDISSMRSDKLTGTEAALLGYWPFDAGIRTVAPDLTGGGNDGDLVGGITWTVAGAPIDACATTDAAGNYALPSVRYGASTEFVVTPRAPRRSFSPPFKTITLTTDSPVQNEVGFTDNTAFTVSGGIMFEGTVCPVPDVSLFVADVRAGVVAEEELKGTSELDGSYAISVDPSIDADDRRRIQPRFVNEQDAGDVHVFTPMLSDPLFVDSDVSDLNFIDTKTRKFSGFFGSSCGFPIGTATLKITTENGCYTQEVQTNADGSFAFDLPPQKYLVEVLDVSSSPLRASVLTFFDAIGAQAIDLTLQPDTLDLIYHAPLKIAVGGMPAASTSCPAGEITQIEDGVELRKLSVVPLLTLGDKVTLDVEVFEDYGTLGECPATAGTLTLFDGIAEVPEVSFDIEDGPAEYEMVVGAPNVFAGARVEGVDRSFQKSFTAVASVPGQPVATQTEWVIVQGARARTGTFVTVPSEPIPMFVLHDPPGDNSYSYIEKGSSMCTGMDFSESYTLTTEGEQKTLFGLQFIAGTAFGGLFAKETAFFGGITAGISGTTDSNTKDNGFSLCMTTGETFATSADEGFVGPDADVFVGLGLNFTFSEADRLGVTEQCVLSVDDILGVGIDVDDPIATTYHFTRGLLRDTMIPQLRENAARETGAAQTEQENAANRFEQLLEYDAALARDEAFSLLENHSFSAGADVSKSVAYDSTGYVSTGVPTEFSFSVGAAGEIEGPGVKSEFSLQAVRTYGEDTVTNNEGGSSFEIGYVLADDDAGDFFTVDVGQSQCSLTENNADNFTVACDEPLPITRLKKPPFAPGG
ncbi:MAG: hypothetical protein HKN13_04355, partial [Rhodothermales bacterium]|nr:hypothetical protein [Rhodothermales bacterium]